MKNNKESPHRLSNIEYDPHIPIVIKVDASDIQFNGSHQNFRICTLQINDETRKRHVSVNVCVDFVLEENENGDYVNFIPFVELYSWIPNKFDPVFRSSVPMDWHPNK